MTEFNFRNPFDVMIDIETLSTDPHAVVLSLGIVAFTAQEHHILFDNGLEYDQQIEDGRDISGDTIRWWMEQDKEAQYPAFHMRNRSDVATAKEVLAMLSIKDARNIWANSPSFDLVILRDLFRDGNLPWSFRQERDLRTICDGLDHLDIDNFDFPGVPHTPVWDCFYQVERVRDAWSRGRGEAV